MIWPMRGTLLFEEAPSGDGEGGGGGGDSKSTKIKVGTSEYEAKDVESAVSLFNALRDPDSGGEIIEQLARRAGLLDKKGEVDPKLTPEAAEKKITGKVTKYFKEKLGKDFEKFSDTVGPLIDQAVQELLDEKFGEQEVRSSALSWESQVEKFTENFTLTEAIENKMKDLMEEAPPNTKLKGFDAQRYLGHMYRAAIEELDIEVPAPERRVKGRSRGHAENDEDIPTFVVRQAPKDLTLDQAIDAATKGIRYKR